MPFQMLLLCTANVCRSPLAAALMRHRLGDETCGSISVDSAGVEAVHNSPPCLRAVRLLRRWGIEVADGTVARAVGLDELEQSHLLLCADRKVVGHVRALRPESRGRLFTIREAATLLPAVTAGLASGGPPGGLGFGLRPEPQGADTAARLTWLVEEMDAARGLVTMNERHPRRAFPVGRGREPLSSYDVPDPHRDRSYHHDSVLKFMSGDVSRVADGLRLVVGT